MTTEVLQPPKLSLTRLLLLGASSVVLCMSYIMSVFTPFPVAMAVVLYGRARGYGIGLLGLGLSFPLGYYMTGDWITLPVTFAGLMVFAVVVAETLLRSWKPVKSIVISGVATLAVLAGVFGFALREANLSPVQFFVQQIDQAKTKLAQAHEKGQFDKSLMEMGLDSPSQELALNLAKEAPGYIFMAVFFVLWINMFLGLKGQRLLKTASSVSYDERQLMGFKMPFFWAYFVAIALALIVGADYWQLTWGDALGYNMLRMLGVFYFFQGFGVLLDYLNHFGVMGLFRTLFVMGIILVMPSLMALLGLFDTWFDFTKKIQKKTFKENL